MSLTGMPSTKTVNSMRWAGEIRRTDQPEPILRISEIAPLSFTEIAVLIMVLPGIDNANVIGILASVLAFMVFVPQALRVWRLEEEIIDGMDKEADRIKKEGALR